MVALLLLPAMTFAVPSDPAPTAPSSIDALNQRFLQYVDELGPTYALAAERVRAGWIERYRDVAPESFVVDSLAVLHPAFGEALAAFDEDRLAEAAAAFAELRLSPDPYVAANAEYFHARALAALGRFDDVASELSQASLEPLDRYSAYGPHARFLLAASYARLLEYEQARATLDSLDDDVATPELVRMAARQLRLEIERRESGTLGEVATIMDYVADHLKVANARDNVQRRQQEILDLLDRLIEQQQQKEQQSGGGGRRGGRPQDGRPSQATPSNPRDESQAPEGSGRIGDLHAAPSVDPGEVWGELPPAERERILQAIRERYPSRYRQIVEQYYRSLAEEK
ncbi:MAG: hypothetical protein D6744_13410 [Planctomycetota bacterium]|nr:MAG: hypothetical protein D6744_13410 [Planctomycetota bacterium]